MENKTRGTGKAKKVVIGVATIVAVAAIAVPTALTLTGGKDDAGASTSNNKYNVIVSSGIDGVPDYSLTIADGTKISELKSILKGVDGYRIEGIYKDDAMNHPYSDNETISSSTKIYIKFVAVTYTVNIYAEDGTTLVSTEEVNHKDSLSLVAPTKPEDNFATYEFMGWYNERNELVNLNEITSDLNIHPYYETHMKDYRIGFIYEAFKSSISVTIGGTPVTLDSTYHYGAKIVIRATQKVGRDITEFKVKVGTGETQDILTEAYRHEENGVVYYEYELDGNGDLSITYNEAASEYSIGQIPSQVTVTRNGHTLSSNEAIYYGDQLSISYRETEGYHKDTFSVDGAEYVGGVWIVKGDLTIEYTESRNAYVLGSIPAGVTVRCGGELLSSNSTIYWGDELTFTYTETSRRDTGNTKQESGYHYIEVETITYALTANGNTLSSGATINVSENIYLNLNNSSRIEWEQGEKVQYSLGTIPSGVTVKRNGITLSSNATIYWGDVLTFTYENKTIRFTGETKEQDYFIYKEVETIVRSLVVNGITSASGNTITVSGDVSMVLNTNTSTTWEKGERVTFSNASWTRINEIAQAGDAATVFSVGDEKDITLTDGEVLTVVILGFNHDNLTSGGKAKMSIGMKHLTKTTAKMNTTNTNAGGWEASAMRTTLNDYYNKLPDDLKSVIKAVNKTASAGNKSTEIVTTSDKLWLFSAAEIWSNTGIDNISWTSWTTEHRAVYKSEGSQYEYYRNLIGDQTANSSCTSLVKNLSNGAGRANTWWLRSPGMFGSSYFLYVNSSGSIYISNANISYGVCFGYCI